MLSKLRTASVSQVSLRIYISRVCNIRGKRAGFTLKVALQSRSSLVASNKCIVSCEGPINHLTRPWLWPDHAGMHDEACVTDTAVHREPIKSVCTLQTCWFSARCTTWEMGLLLWCVLLRQPSLNKMLYQRTEVGPCFISSSHIL